MTGENLFSAPFALPDDQAFLPLQKLLDEREANAPELADKVKNLAETLILSIRENSTQFGGVEELLHAYSLSTKEGTALMTLAEALLRASDNKTIDEFIEDRLAQGDWAEKTDKNQSTLVSVSGKALGLSARIMGTDENNARILGNLTKRIGKPVIRNALLYAMKFMADYFVLGETIEEGLVRAEKKSDFLYSFDMLGEGARTASDALRYQKAYEYAIEKIGSTVSGPLGTDRPFFKNPGISVKLSALHPRYEALNRAAVLRDLVPVLLKLAKQAQFYNLNLTIDAEEADRLELSLDIFAEVLADPSLGGKPGADGISRSGFGLAVQAYQKRAFEVIGYIEGLARQHKRQIPVRLVKGAYWDSEIKRAQERGLKGYPVWTRKAVTDAAYLACAQRLLAARPLLYPQFATHNALTVAEIVALNNGVEGLEFQRLHGMGESLYQALLKRYPKVLCRVYAPVGGHKELLAYLVRRLLENGANSGFVSGVADKNIPPEALLVRPQTLIKKFSSLAHEKIPLPQDMYAPERKNSSGAEFGHRETLQALLRDIDKGALSYPHSAFSDHKERFAEGDKKRVLRQVILPADGKTVIGQVDELLPEEAGALIEEAALEGFPLWAGKTPSGRAEILRKAAELLEARRGEFLALLQREAGKTLDDAWAELREAVDFCTYYAVQAERVFQPQIMPGPTGELNRLCRRPRGVFVTIAPWNFPLAIFLGQITAALAGGNAVVAKPAEQTPLTGFAAVNLLHEAGVPASALKLALGDGRVGAALVSHRAVAGVAFTGSTETAFTINRTLAAKNGPIVPLIAETGGINALIADDTALPEQVTDDVISSAFRSAGQRCSALRILCLYDGPQADKIIKMIEGAADQLRIGNPSDPSVHVGPVIDGEAHGKLLTYIQQKKQEGRLLSLVDHLPAEGFFVPPAIIQLDRVADLKEEIFGPVLHIVRWDYATLPQLLQEIEGTGYGLTLGIHSRIEKFVNRIIERLAVGNIYVNRNIIGAVVGTQPFGGSGLSGTGPKAGGPDYLKRFTEEQHISINTTASGGNASLLTEII